MALPQAHGSGSLMRWTAAAIFLLLAMPCAAQETESITVHASALVGAWKLTQPSYAVKEGLFGDIKFGPLSDNFCRIEQQERDLTIHCLVRGVGRVTLDRGNIRLAWGIVMARVVIESVLQPDLSFTGHETIKLVGISIEDPNMSSGRKADLSGPDKSGLAQMLRGAIAQGLARTPHDGAVKDNPALRADLGSIQAVVYLGQQDKFASPDAPDIKGYFAVYAVEFENGERICGLHQGDDGKLDAFQCR
ncbi:MAG TPA: hypothetical protein VJM78_06495 [Rhizomicrobium sp.]|nr:hypothetical protein [Rhizomicrobium sp.]